MDASWAPQWSSLVGYWKMNNNWNDAKGSNNGTATGATFTAGAKAGSHAGSFDGSTNYVKLASDIRPTSAITLSAWVKPSATNSYGAIIEHAYDNSSSWNSPYISYQLSQSNGSSGNPSFNLAFGGSLTVLPAWTKLAVGTWDPPRRNLRRDDDVDLRKRDAREQSFPNGIY